jgi:hypothetical protein
MSEALKQPKINRILIAKCPVSAKTDVKGIP